MSPNSLTLQGLAIKSLKSVGKAKQMRSQVEKDVDLLHNRIRMLQMEEFKAMKKIEETRKKAEKIMELRRENDRKYEERMKEQMRYQRMLKKRKNEKYGGKDYLTLVIGYITLSL